MIQSSNNDPIISFCISTFNRAEKIVKLITEILKYEGTDIEVVVSDNCSTDNTRSELSKIKDVRFHYHNNNSNIGAIQNYVKVMSLGKGQYIFFSTDKDYIKASGISDLIEFLKKKPNIIAGYCALDIYNKIKNEVLEQGFISLKKIGYLSRHPTGYFFQNIILNNLQIIKNYSNVEQVGSFPFEFILAEFCMRGKTAIINIPLCYIETMDDVKSIKSYSYSGTDNNLYFSPSQRYKMLERYINNLKTLELLKREKRTIAKYIFNKGLANATFEYKSMLQNEIVCAHYNITSRNVGLFEIFKIDYNFSSNFIINCRYSNVLVRTIICLQTHFEFIMKKLVNR